MGVPRSSNRQLMAALVFVLLLSLVAGCSSAPRTAPAPESAQLKSPVPTVAATAIAAIVPGPTITLLPAQQRVSLSPSPTLLSTAVPRPSVAPAPVASDTISAFTSASEPPALPTVWPGSRYPQLFDEIWDTVNDNYLYADFRGVDWVAVREEYARRLAEVADDAAFYSLMAEMVGQLADQHSRFLPPSAASAEDVRASGHEEQVGIGVLTVALPDAALIQQVFPQSPASQAGLLPRDRIVAINGQFYANVPIEGPVGTQVRLTIARPGEASRDVVLTRQLVEGRIEPLIHRLDDNDVAYVAVTTLWVNDMGEQVAEELTRLEQERPLRGLILDLRGNPGGWRNVLTDLLSPFVRGEVGTFFSRRADQPLVIEPGPGPDLQGLPLVVLIDSGTASYAELLAGILQREAGAWVVGSPSAGNIETIYAYNLADGARLWVAQEGFRLRDGVNFEGTGLKPDVPMTFDWTRYSEALDPGIIEGLRLVNEQYQVVK